MKGKPVIVLKVGPELNTILELFIQDFPNGVCVWEYRVPSQMCIRSTDRRNAACRCPRAVGDVSGQ
eukprot:15334205-Alexandrium_andersonii.AAC.1